MNRDLSLSCGCVHCKRVLPTALPIGCLAKCANIAAKVTSLLQQKQRGCKVFGSQTVSEARGK